MNDGRRATPSSSSARPPLRTAGTPLRTGGTPPSAARAPLRAAAAIPAYQAARSVAAVVEGARAALPPGADVLVVDDGSSDGTDKAARAAGALVLRHGRNRGKGDALRTAFGELMARGAEAVVTLDADGQHDPAEIPRLLRRMEETDADLCVGSRMADIRTMPWVRRLANRGGSALLSLLAGQRLDDTQSGYRVYRCRHLPLLMTGGSGYDYESEVLIRASRLGMLLVFESVSTHYGDETSHFRPLRDGWRFLRLVARNLPGAWPRRRARQADLSRARGDDKAAT